MRAAETFVLSGRAMSGARRQPAMSPALQRCVQFSAVHAVSPPVLPRGSAVIPSIDLTALALREEAGIEQDEPLRRTAHGSFDQRHPSAEPGDISPGGEPPSPREASSLRAVAEPPERAERQQEAGAIASTPRPKAASAVKLERGSVHVAAPQPHAEPVRVLRDPVSGNRIETGAVAARHSTPSESRAAAVPVRAVEPAVPAAHRLRDVTRPSEEVTTHTLRQVAQPPRPAPPEATIEGAAQSLVPRAGSTKAPRVTIMGHARPGEAAIVRTMGVAPPRPVPIAAAVPGQPAREMSERLAALRSPPSQEASVRIDTVQVIVRSAPSPASPARAPAPLAGAQQATAPPLPPFRNVWLSRRDRD